MGKGAPAPPGYWEPAQGPATPAGLGLGGFCTAGRVCHPPSPGTKPSFYWNFGRQNNQGLLFYRAPRGNLLRGCSRTAQLPIVPTVTTQSHKKGGNRGSGIAPGAGWDVGAGSSSLTAHQAGAAPSHKISFPSKNFQ